jgi:hypothetical protein
MKPRDPGTPPLGQLLVDRGVLTSTQLYQVSLEQRVTGKPLGLIMMERGLASPDVLEDASYSSSDDMPIDSPLSTEEAATVEDERPRGLRERAARRLDAYLAATAAELDERGGTLGQRSLELDAQAERLAAAESELEQRARRLRDLGIEDANGPERMDQLLQVVAGRDAQVEEIAQEGDRVRKELALAREQLAAKEAEAARAGATLTVAEDRLRELQAENAALKASCREAEAVLIGLQQTQRTQAEELAHARRLLDERSQRVSELEGALADARATVAKRELSQSTHLLHVPGSGCYALVERPGPPPKVGERISQDRDADGRFVVTRLGASPLAHDERTCAYVQPE